LTVNNRIPKYIRDVASTIHPVGSRVTCSPAPSGTDEDLVILLRQGSSFPHRRLEDDAWTQDGSRISDQINRVPPEDRFNSFKLDNVNLIITSSPSFFGRFMAATSVAKRLNLMEKADRIALFQAVLYGNPCVQDAPMLDIDEGTF
jgi:hypothetical protein